jgi:hypothetical protein
MSARSYSLALVGTLALGSWIVWPSVTHAASITQTASVPLTTTDFNTGGTSGIPPLVFQQFDTQGGTRVLNSVEVSLNAAIQSSFSMNFTTPATITDSLATGNPSEPGPQIILYKPDGTTQILTVQVPNDPMYLTRSVTYGSQSGQTLPQQFSSSLSPGSPYYLAPSVTNQAHTSNLTSASDIALFTGQGTVALPLSALAQAQFSSSSGNGGGSISTEGSATVTVKYDYSQIAPQQVPEPAGILVWSLAIGAGGCFIQRCRRRG